MQERDLGRDRVSGTFDERCSAAEQGCLETELGLLCLLVDLRAEKDQPVRVPQSGIHRRSTTADDDLVALVVHDLEVIRKPQALLILG